MKIKYMGPSPSVNIGGYPAQKKGEIVEYPDDVGEELLVSGKKQKFVCVEKQEETGGKPEKKAQVKKDK